MIPILWMIDIPCDCSAAVVSGDGFLGRSFKVQNTAGSAGQQAVSYRGSADALAFYQVTFDGYQDTLYANAGRHYYRECTILGTVDFIFGNAAASFQSCTVIAKTTTLLGQQNTYTAQGRTDPHQSTGLSFQNCKFDGTPEVKANPALYKTYLGRPWNPYSVCVVMKSELLGHIDPTGWLPWNASNYGLYTSYFAEYQNFGAGATPAARVNWSHQIALAGVAAKYTANSFMQAGVWMRGYDVPLTADL